MTSFKKLTLFLATASLCSLAAGEPAAPAMPAPNIKPSFDRFKMVQTRNIFSPDRRAMIAPRAGPAPASDMKPVTHADYVALTGIMVSEGKALAFFTGSRPEYNKVLAVAGSIAGATLTHISLSNIEVLRDGKTMTIAVGQTVPFDGTAPVAAPGPSASVPDSQSANGSAPPPTADSTSPSPAPAADTSEVMRRMMEKRQQELK